MPDPEFIDPRQIQPGPICHESLPSELLDQIRVVYDVLGQYVNLTLAEFEGGFRRDADPESEVDLWLDITAVWIDYHTAYLDDVDMSDADEQKLLSALIAISAGVEDPSQLGVPHQIGQRLLDCYDKFQEELDQALDEEEN